MPSIACQDLRIVSARDARDLRSLVSSPFEGLKCPETNGHCHLHDSLPPPVDSEGHVSRFVPQDALLDYFAMMGFSAAFCRRPNGHMVLPPYVQGDFLPNPHIYAPTRPDMYKRLYITPVYAWTISPDNNAIAALVDSLKYTVFRCGSSIGFEDIPYPSATATSDDANAASFSDMFEAHKHNFSFLCDIAVREPRVFLDMANAVFAKRELSNVQFWDCVLIIEKLADSYYLDDVYDLDNAHELRAVWETLVEAGLCYTIDQLLDKLQFLEIVSALVRVTLALVKTHDDVDQRLPLSPFTARFYDKFWLRFGQDVKLTQRITDSYALIYHNPQIFNAEIMSAKLTGLIMHFVLHSLSLDTTLSASISPQAYRMIGRTGLRIWFNVDFGIPDDTGGRFDYANMFLQRLLSFFSDDQTGLIQRDLDTFVREDIIREYGAEAFMIQLNRVLTFLRNDTRTETQLDRTKVSLNNLESVVVYPEFRQHYAPTGFIRALCRLVDNPHLLQYDDSKRWLFNRRVLCLIDAILKKTPIAQAAKPLLRYGIFSVLAQASFLYARAGLKDDYLIDNVVRPFKVIAGGARARGSGRDKELFDMIKESTQPDWWSTIDSLHRLMFTNLETAFRANHMQKVWFDLGDALGLDRNREKAAYERERKRVGQFCAAKECEFHEVAPPTPTRTCAGCGEVRYCSRVCQQNDWKKGHGWAQAPMQTA